MEMVYWSAGIVTGAIVVTVGGRNTRLTRKFENWNWPSFGAGAAFALALFIIAGKIQP